MIRKATPDDLDCVTGMENKYFPMPWSRASFEAEITSSGSDFLIYDIDGSVAGYIVFTYVLDEAELAVVAVDGAFRRRGIAEKLLSHCIGLHAGIKNIYLEVEKTNSAAIALYKKFGFNINGEIKDYYGAGKNAYRMSMPVPEQG